ncbi:bifunctional 4-hydroxy-2-oxoglutarate aldolase/2-dehydro-3-deoxy-phosphogluconate aldolase [Enterocloster lavalensis]|uniref:2-dehydro-3-deoxyphosphogluconate aldolase / (4S)-4-hydroxy-2-oxoglutarate aldolase n=1 Tax=Enterocloster lavalensis TaxID=460384 RepID=A0A1I0BSR8_9FIRM|nr:bifunctional 4-hydroxy-2-oxoglutarate aldolase/2-dehydro-3-deoxy-phosphogluconate aldolase [Enterocloster lavalensis]SET09380.1 2-dehydro-3-deoxyphosphogluconate aldolase / (4S)-4-hydroxy-2-oxoglutarate aldolase [Enterocloster lavalensis]
MNQEMVTQAIKKHKVVAILRGIERESVEPVIDALYEGGIRLLEITFNQKSLSKLQDTAAAISYAKKKYGNSMYVGAGTVMSVEEVICAENAGASFILSPNVNERVLRAAVERNMCAVPGAMTPTEIVTAYEAGAAFVKLFPAGNMGLAYCKAVMAPINHIPLMAVGGIGLDNLRDYLCAGFESVGVGSSLTCREMIRNKEYSRLSSLAAEYMQAATAKKNL